MDIRHVIGCGLDVHKDSVTAFFQRLEPGGEATKRLRTFGTMPPDVLTLHEYLTAACCTHVVSQPQPRAGRFAPAPREDMDADGNETFSVFSVQPKI